MITSFMIRRGGRGSIYGRSEEHTSELQSLRHLVCRLLLEKKQIAGPGEKPLKQLDRRAPVFDGAEATVLMKGFAVNCGWLFFYIMRATKIILSLPPTIPHPV